MSTFTMAQLITEVKITPLNSQGSKTVAFAGVTLGGHIVLKDMKVIEGSNGLFVSFPQRKATIAGEEKYLDIYHPITKEGREDLTKIVLEHYAKAKSGDTKSGSGSASSGRGDSERSNGGSNRGGDSRSTGRTPSGAGARGGADRGVREDDDVPF